jgi:hypothetical protein
MTDTNNVTHISRGMCRVSFDGFDNSDLSHIFVDLLRKLSDLIPGNIEEILVFASTKLGEGTVLSVNMNYSDYHSVTINVDPIFFTLDRETMSRQLIHELVHFHHTEVLLFLTDQIYPQLKGGNEELNELLKKQMRSRIEQFTQRFAEFIARKVLK